VVYPQLYLSCKLIKFPQVVVIVYNHTQTDTDILKTECLKQLIAGEG